MIDQTACARSLACVCGTTNTGVVGEYLLHVRLRQQAVSLPGSPFCLSVVPNLAHARSTKLPRDAIVGLVGADAGCKV